MKAAKLLARLMGRQAGGVVPLLYARAINQPLLVEPGLGEALIQGYLAAGDMDGERRNSILHIQEGIAVIDIAGPLVAREVVVPCEESPTSYEAIGRALETALDDPGVETILFRLDTPGGEADGCFDLSDQIYAARGAKKMIAVVDRAYSGGYAIASACDEIWVSRTAGVGSVGVVTYHVDQSEFNARQGIKVEYIHAGARKVDGSPHQPLTEEARGWMQAEIDRLYGIFVETVARNRGMSVEAVRATEAGCFFAEGAVAAGLADKVGNFGQVLAASSFANLEAPDEQAAPTEPAQVETPDPVAAATAAHLAIVKACTEAGVPQMAAQFIETGLELDAVTAALADADEIRTLCAAAGMPDKANGYITAKTSVEQVRTELLQAKAAAEVEIDNKISPQTAPPAKRPNAAAIYEKRRKAAQK